MRRRTDWRARWGRIMEQVARFSITRRCSTGATAIGSIVSNALKPWSPTWAASPRTQSGGVITLRYPLPITPLVGSAVGIAIPYRPLRPRAARYRAPP
jgi:hypothetical protein